MRREMSPGTFYFTHGKAHQGPAEYSGRHQDARFALAEERIRKLERKGMLLKGKN
jgi:hypothetical protein